MRLGDQEITDLKLGETQITKVFIGDQLVWEVGGGEDPAQEVIDRMTNPSQPFEDAIREYVESEVAASNDNWVLTDEIFFFNVDTHTNAMVGWKGSSLVSGDNSASFFAYEGITGDSNRVTIEFDYQFGTNHTTLGDGWIMLNGRDFTPGASNNNNLGNFAPSNPTGASTRFVRAGGTNMTSIAFGGGSNSYSIPEPETTVFLTRAQPDGLIQRYRNGQIDGGITRTINLTPAENLQWWNGHGGYHMGFGAGFSQNGFDLVANYAHIKRFNDRMLFQKHLTTINTVLSRYTGLTEREEFAVGLFVANMIEAGAWDEVDEVFCFALYDPSNAKIGMKQVTATDTGVPTHSPGVGLNFNGVDSALASNFIPSINATNMVPGDGMISVNVDDHPAIVTKNSTVFGVSDGSFQILFRREVTILRSRLNSGQNMSRQTDNDWKVPRYRATQIVLDNAGSPRGELFKNRVQRGTINNYSQNASLVTQQVQIGAYNSAGTLNQWIESTIRSITFGKSLKTTGDASKLQAFFVAEDLMLNMLEAGNPGSRDWNVQDALYDYSERYLEPIESEEILAYIVSVTDQTSGRTLDLSSANGLTQNSLAYITTLESNGWTVVT